MLTVKIFLSTQTEKNVTLGCKMAKILTISRKSQHPIETLLYSDFHTCYTNDWSEKKRAWRRKRH